MCRLIFLSVLYVFLLFLPLNASSVFDGQRIYLKECRVCHLGSRIFIDSHTHLEWENILDTNGSSLSKIHLSKNVVNVKSKDGNYKDSHSYFKSKKYTKKYKELKNFIIKFSQKNENSFYLH